MKLLGIALIIFFVLLLVNIGIIVVTFIKGGKLVKKDSAFIATQLYTLISSILLIIYRADGRIIGYIIGVFFIMCSIGVIWLKKIDFLLARILSVVVLLFANLAFWYNEKHTILLVLTLATIVLATVVKNILSKILFIE